MRGKEQLIASARARGQTADEALASTDDAVAQDQLASLDSSAVKSESDTRAELRLLRDFENSVEAGFQMATFQGPLCAEPTVGMAWVVERIEHSKDEEEGEWSQRNPAGEADQGCHRCSPQPTGNWNESPRVKGRGKLEVAKLRSCEAVT